MGVAPRVVAAGLRCIVSNQNKWYLDHLTTTWKDFYMNEPLTNITDPKHRDLVIGGEVCMWGETVDGSDIEQTIWPRAAAAAGTHLFPHMSYMHPSIYLSRSIFISICLFVFLTICWYKELGDSYQSMRSLVTGQGHLCRIPLIIHHRQKNGIFE